jgi:hypothetical protein
LYIKVINNIHNQKFIELELFLFINMTSLQLLKFEFKFELDLAEKVFRIMPYLDVCVCLDEVYGGEARPPHLEADGDPHLALQPLCLFHHYNHFNLYDTSRALDYV